MKNKTWILSLAVVLSLGGALAGCAAVTDGGVGEALTGEIPGDPGIAVPGQGDPVYFYDGGAEPWVEVPEYEADVPVDPVDVDRAPCMETPENVVDMPTDPQVDYDHAAAVGRVCGDMVCGELERCCHVTARCVPVDCEDCCDLMVDPPEDNPRLVPDEPGPV